MFKFKKKYLANSAVFILVVLSFSLFFRAPRNVILSILKSPLGIVSIVRRETGALIFFHRNFIRNEMLQKENYLLRQKINSFYELYAENARLKKIISFKQQSSYRVIAARVISRSADSWSSIVVIDKGNSHGIKAGMAAVTFSGLAGRVIESQKDTAKVMLINDPDFAVSAVSQRSRQEGLISGTLGSFLLMKYLPEAADIKEKDSIITSGLNPAYPKGIAIGSVVEIGTEFSGLSRYALVKPAVNLSSIEEILIVVP